MLLRPLVLISLFASPLLAMENRPASPAGPSTNRPSTPPHNNHPFLSFDKSYDCLKKPIVGEHTLLKPDAFFCALALQQILKADKAEAPMLISRTDGFKVPHSWVAGNCNIFINTAGEFPDRSVTMPLFAVVQQVRVIMQNCINNTPGLGGTSVIESWDDSGGLLDVVVIGKDMPKYEMSPSIRMAGTS
ncbi:hypothetical protein MMC16_000684 [Acarospora aff. strigata]|nr:hypothetical protein [Acarospora aff. strigata]